jgi:hypothetical protein
MRPGLGRLIVGVAFIAAGFLAPMLVPGIQWWGAFLVGTYFIVRGGYTLFKSSRTGWEHLSKKQ